MDTGIHSCLRQEMTNVDISRRDGRVHSAMVTVVNLSTDSVTVEWEENGVMLGKELPMEKLKMLNPHLIASPKEPANPNLNEGFIASPRKAGRKKKSKNKTIKKEVNSQTTTKDDIEDFALCTICADLYIEPITLNCSHSFCAYCVNKWRSNNSNCPLCRSTIISCNRTLAMDVFIDQLVDKMSAEFKARRKQTIADRKNDK